MSKTNTGATATKRILIVDDHPIVRDGLAMLIGQQKDMEVCGEAETVGGALEQIRQTRPDVVIVDIILKEGSGLDLIKRIQMFDESILILVSSMHNERLFAERAIRAGAKGYVTKQVASRKMIEAIRAILTGKIYLSEEMSQRILHNAADGGGAEGSPVESLSDRELTVFELIGQGFSTKKIAEQLHLSVKTIETYREKIKEKLNLENAAELTSHAVRWVLEKA